MYFFRTKLQTRKPKKTKNFFPASQLSIRDYAVPQTSKSTKKATNAPVTKISMVENNPFDNLPDSSDDEEISDDSPDVENVVQEEASNKGDHADDYNVAVTQESGTVESGTQNTKESENIHESENKDEEAANNVDDSETETDGHSVKEPENIDTDSSTINIPFSSSKFDASASSGFIEGNESHEENEPLQSSTPKRKKSDTDESCRKKVKAMLADITPDIILTQVIVDESTNNNQESTSSHSTSEAKKPDEENVMQTVIEKILETQPLPPYEERANKEETGTIENPSKGDELTATKLASGQQKKSPTKFLIDEKALRRMKKKNPDLYNQYLAAMAQDSDDSSDDD